MIFTKEISKLPEQLLNQLYQPSPSFRFVKNKDDFIGPRKFCQVR